MKPQTVYIQIPVEQELPKTGWEGLISYDGGETYQEVAAYLERRTCMMAGSAGGNGYFGEGFATSGFNGCDRGLILDPPTHWLEKKSSCYVLTEEELREIILGAVYRGQNNIDAYGNYIGIGPENSRDEYIQSLQTKQP